MEIWEHYLIKACLSWCYWVGKGADETEITKHLVWTHEEALWPRPGHIRTGERGAQVSGIHAVSGIYWMPAVCQAPCELGAGSTVLTALLSCPEGLMPSWSPPSLQWLDWSLASRGLSSLLTKWTKQIARPLGKLSLLDSARGYFPVFWIWMHKYLCLSEAPKWNGSAP